MNFNKYLLSLLVISFTGFSANILSQDVESVDSTDVDGAEKEVEEVVVTGIKSSLLDAIEIKRSNVGVMEAITAEDFGKFPDGNLAESLARVAGVGIDRSNVEGQRVAVRGFGPEFNLVTLNGRQMPTVPGQWGGGRSFNFGDIASPGVAAVELFKSSNSALPSGGIGSTINMVTTKPLSIDGTKQALSYAIVEDTTSVKDIGKSGRPEETSYLFATNKGKWGFALSASHQQRSNREEGTRESNWLSHPQIISVDGYDRLATATNVTNNSNRSDGVTFYQEPTAYQIKDNKRTRRNAQATFQFIAGNTVNTIDHTYSGVDFSSTGQMFGSWLGGWDTLSGTVNENGAYTDVVVGNRAYDHQYIWGETSSENKSNGFNSVITVNDALTVIFDYHNSTAELNGSELPNEMGITTDKRATITHTNGGSSGINTWSYDNDFLASDYYVASVAMHDAYKENHLKQAKLSGEWVNLGGGMLPNTITSIEFGVSQIENQYADRRASDSIGAQGPNAAQYADSIFTRTSLGGFMDGFSPNIGTNYYFAINGAEALNTFASINGMPTAGPIDTNERINEDLDSAFVQFNIETEYMGMPLNVVAGVRYEESATESISLEATPDTIRWDMIEGFQYISSTGIVDAARYGSNDRVLPNLLMSLALDDNQVVRFSASKSMSRPSLQDLRSQLSFYNRDYITPVASGGNPNLEPLGSTNIDLAYENYYAEGSYFAVNAFYKEIEDFISSSTEYSTVGNITNPAAGTYAFAVSCVQEWVAAGRPQTGFPGDAGATGHCVSQQALWAQGWMNDFQHMGWVAVAMSRGVDVSNGFPWAGCGDYDGWWRCDPGYVDGSSADPLAVFEITRPMNLETGEVSGVEVTLQHLFEGTPYGMQFNYTAVSGGDVEVDTNVIGEQFILPGLGDSGNLSFFFEDDKHTARLALNYRGEVIAGFGNYQQPLFVEARSQVDASYQYRINEDMTLFLDMMNITDETTRLFARHSEMLFLSQDHGPVFKLGFRANF